MVQRDWIGGFIVAVSAISFATLAIFAKLAYGAGVNIITVLTVRFLLAAVVLWLIVKARPQDVSLTGKQRLCVLLMGGVGYGTMSGLFFLTVKLISPAMGGLLLYFYPVFVFILSAWLREEQVTVTKTGALVLSFTGLVLTLGITAGRFHALGLLTGLGAAAVYSIYIIIGNRLVKQVPALLTSAYVTTAAGGVYFFAGVGSGSLHFTHSPAAWLYMVLIALIPTVLAIIAFFEGMRRIGAAQAAIISTMEPVVTVILSALFFGEQLTWAQITGGIMILGGVLLLQHRQRQEEPKTVSRRSYGQNL